MATNGGLETAAIEDDGLTKTATNGTPSRKLHPLLAGTTVATQTHAQCEPLSLEKVTHHINVSIRNILLILVQYKYKYNYTRLLKGTRGCSATVGLLLTDNFTKCRCLDLMIILPQHRHYIFGRLSRRAKR